jgi:hypothetical protein
MSNDRYILELPDDRNATVTEVPSEPRPDESKRRRGVRVTTAALAAAVGLALGGGLLATSMDAGAATTSSTGTTSSGGMPGGCTPPSAVGTVKSVGSDSFVVATSQGGTSTIEVTASTRYQDKGVTGASLANVTVGEHVAVMGSLEAGTVTAASVLIGEPPSDAGRGPGPYGGTPPKGTPPPQHTASKGAPAPQGTGAEA